eukprot:tig00001094_g6989.t1
MSFFSRGALDGVGRERRESAAISIQARWRGHTARRRLEALNGVVAFMQALYRGRLRRRAFLRHLRTIKEFRQAQQKQMLIERRRKKRQAELEKLQSAAPGEIPKFVNADDAAAKKIQAVWRRRRARLLFQRDPRTREQHGAAAVIQRSFRWWRRGRRNALAASRRAEQVKNSMATIDQLLSNVKNKLSPERVKELQKTILQRRREFVLASPEELAELQGRVEEGLRRWAPLRAVREAVAGRREALLRDTAASSTASPAGRRGARGGAPAPAADRLAEARRLHQRACLMAQPGQAWRRFLDE